jgi:hypothetical protein
MKKQPATPILMDRINRPTLKLPKLVVRPGAMEVLQYPSRIADSLFYPDGRVVKDESTR